ncbi:MAG TPA: carbohydrate ABC transporter permease [Bacillota bacterium]|nr:carbohydrate ABC transporter permease [Bacillota bacterium]
MTVKSGGLLINPLKIKACFIQLMLVLFAAVQVFPLIWLAFFSLKDNHEIFGGNVLGLPHRFLWNNYAQAIIQGNVGLYFFNSCIVTFSTIIISGIFATMASYAITRMQWKFSKLVLTVFLLGLMIPIHSTLLPLFIILRKMHLLNSYLALIIPYVAFALPMAIFIFSGFLHTIPRDLEEAACLDGCGIYRIFFWVILPLLKPAIATVSIFTYLASWNELMFAVVFVNNEQYKTLTVGIMSMVGRFVTEWGPIGAGLVIGTLPTVLIYALMSRQVQNSLTTGALKG